MQATTQVAKGELLFELQGKTSSWTIKEITPHGVKMQMNDEARSTGKLNGAQINTVDAFMKTDGTQDWESRALLNTPEGDMVIVSGRGTGRRPNPNLATWQGDLVFMSQAPRLSWLNNTKGWVEGSAEMAQGTYQAKIYAKK